MQTADNFKVKFSSFSAETNAALEKMVHDVPHIFATDRSQVITPDLETPFSRADLTHGRSAHKFEVLSIRAIVTERQQQLDGVEHEMSGLKAVVDILNGLHEQLGQKQDKITQSMILHKGLVSPLRKLPTEILSLIFIHCLPEDSHLSLTQSTAPVLFTRICRQWREVALDMPRLWCRLHLKLKNRGLNQQDNLYHLCLKRSQGRPLSLVIDCYADQMRMLRKFLQSYGSHILSLSIPSFRRTCEVLKKLPALQELALNNTTSRTAITKCIEVLGPTVRSLKVTGLFSLGGDPSAIPTVALALLTHIELSQCSLSGVIRLIRPSSNLSSLVIHRCTGGQIPDTDSAQVLTHTAIQSLRILEANLYATALLPSLFNTLSLPNLRVLEVSGSQVWAHEEVKAFLGRSNCPLGDLILGAGMVMTDDQRAEYIALIPSLVVTHFIE